MALRRASSALAAAAAEATQSITLRLAQPRGSSGAARALALRAAPGDQAAHGGGPASDKADEAQAPLKGRFNRSWHAVFTRAVTAAGGIGTCSLQGVHAALQELGVAATESQVRERLKVIRDPAQFGTTRVRWSKDLKAQFDKAVEATGGPEDVNIKELWKAIGEKTGLTYFQMAHRVRTLKKPDLLQGRPTQPLTAPLKERVAAKIKLLGGLEAAKPEVILKAVDGDNPTGLKLTQIEMHLARLRKPFYSGPWPKLNSEMLEAIDDAIASLGGPEVATAAAVRAAGGEVLQEVRYYQLQKLLNDRRKAVKWSEDEAAIIDDVVNELGGPHVCFLPEVAAEVEQRQRDISAVSKISSSSRSSRAKSDVIGIGVTGNALYDTVFARVMLLRREEREARVKGKSEELSREEKSEEERSREKSEDVDDE